MTADEAYRRVAAQLSPDFVGRFYSSGTNLGLGKGKIYKSIRCPIYDPAQDLYLTAESLVYVLTHECDVDSDNERVFNQELLICPILKLDDLIAEYQEMLPGEKLSAFLGNLGSKNISRLVFLPPIPGELDFGGVLYLNQITHTHVTAFNGGSVHSICSVTAFGLEHIEYGLENHLLRPKAERLAFSSD